MKFGGTSVGNAKNITDVAAIIKKALPEKPIVVVSAVRKMTNALIALAHEPQSVEIYDVIHTTHTAIVKELGLSSRLLAKEFKELENLRATMRRRGLTPKTLDHFQSFGERMCARILAAELEKKGVGAKAFPAWEIGMITDRSFGDAEPLPTTPLRIRKEMESVDMVPVVTGFIGKTEAGDIITLGRGGSDYTAAIIGAAIDASVIQIWTDVDGIMTTDPRMVSAAQVVPELAFEEACELAYFGAKVLHPKTILPAMRRNIPVQVLNTFNPTGKGTTIVSDFAKRREKSHTVEAFAFKRNIVVVHVRSPEFFDGNGLMARIFMLFKKYKTSIDLVATSVVSVSITIDNDTYLDKIIPGLKEIGEISITKDKAIVCAVGGSVNAAGVAGRMFTTLGANRIPVELISQAAGGISITFVVDSKDAERAITVLHKEYIGT